MTVVSVVMLHASKRGQWWKGDKFFPKPNFRIGDEKVSVCKGPPQLIKLVSFGFLRNWGLENFGQKQKFLGFFSIEVAPNKPFHSTIQIHQIPKNPIILSYFTFSTYFFCSILALNLISSLLCSLPAELQFVKWSMTIILQFRKLLSLLKQHWVSIKLK